MRLLARLIGRLMAAYVRLVGATCRPEGQPVTQDPVVLTVGTIRGGQRENIIAEQAEMTGTVRTHDTRGVILLVPQPRLLPDALP